MEEKATGENDVRIATDSYEGAKIIFDAEDIQGFFIFRLSVHDPVIPINFACDISGGLLKIARTLLAWLSEAEGLDLSPLQQFCGEF